MAVELVLLAANADILVEDSPLVRSQQGEGICCGSGVIGSAGSRRIQNA